MGEVIKIDSSFNKDTQNPHGDEATEHRLAKLVEHDRQKLPSRMSVRGFFHGVKNFFTGRAGSSETSQYLPYNPKRKF